LSCSFTEEPSLIDWVLGVDGSDRRIGEVTRGGNGRGFLRILMVTTGGQGLDLEGRERERERRGFGRVQSKIMAPSQVRDTETARYLGTVRLNLLNYKITSISLTKHSYFFNIMIFLQLTNSIFFSN
jgi:hypothetical protein